MKFYLLSALKRAYYDAKFEDKMSRLLSNVRAELGNHMSFCYIDGLNTAKSQFLNDVSLLIEKCKLTADKENILKMAESSYSQIYAKTLASDSGKLMRSRAEVNAYTSELTDLCDKRINDLPEERETLRSKYLSRH